MPLAIGNRQAIGASCIQPQIFYNIYLSCFEHKLYRLAALTQSTPFIYHLSGDAYSLINSSLHRSFVFNCDRFLLVAVSHAVSTMSFVTVNAVDDIIMVFVEGVQCSS